MGFDRFWRLFLSFSTAMTKVSVADQTIILQPAAGKSRYGADRALPQPPTHLEQIYESDTAANFLRPFLLVFEVLLYLAFVPVVICFGFNIYGMILTVGKKGGINRSFCTMRVREHLDG